MVMERGWGQAGPIATKETDRQIERETRGFLLVALTLTSNTPHVVYEVRRLRVKQASTHTVYTS